MRYMREFEGTSIPTISSKNIFLTGQRGVGKTTLLFRAVKTLGTSPGGFVIKKVYDHGNRCAMVMVDLARGERNTLIRYDGGRPIVYTEVFESLGASAVLYALAHKPLVVMDELGRFELQAPRFIEAVNTALSSTVPILGVLKLESNVFLDAIRSRPDVSVIHVARSTRDLARHIFLQNLSFFVK